MNDISNALTRNDVRVALLVGLTIGGVSGFFVAQTLVTKKVQAVADQEIASVKEHYDRKAKLYKEGLYSDPANLVENPVVEETEDVVEAEDVIEAVTGPRGDKGDHVAYDKIIKEQSYSNDDEKEVVVKNVFKERTISLGDRDKDVPYPITTDEFMNNDEFAFDQITLTYFEGDDTLVDEREDIVSDVTRTVGRDNLLRFGQNPKDPDTVYVRNERLRSDFEIVRDPGKYAVSVLGMVDDAERNG